MIRDYILETSNAPGTGTVVNLAGAATDRKTFASSFNSGDPCFYYMDDGAQAEWGLGVFTAGSPNTITRSTVLGNTLNTTARLNFLGTVRVYNETCAARVVYVDNANIYRPLAQAYVTYLNDTGNADIGGSLTAVNATLSGTLTAPTYGGNPTFSGSPTISGTLTAANVTVNTQLYSSGTVFVGSTLYINPANGWEWNIYREAATGDHIQMHRSGWYDRWESSGGVRRWVVNNSNGMTLDASGNLTALGGMYGTVLQCSAGFVMNQTGVAAQWIADASWVYLRFAGVWGFQFDRATGNMHYVNSVGTSLIYIQASGQGIAYTGLGGSYANVSALGWDGTVTYVAHNGSTAGQLLRSDNLGAGYTQIWRQNIAPGGASMYAWYTAGGSAVGWSCGTVSERKLKSNIVPAGDALAAILAMQVYSCDVTLPEFKPRHADYAVIADEIETIIPSSVHEKPESPEGSELFQMVDDHVLTCALIKAVQQLTARVAVLEAKLAA